ncbi:MAG TPA: ABC transporter ATP-binding protein [Candidatus Baltobacteraceae bacterium]
MIDAPSDLRIRLSDVTLVRRVQHEHTMDLKRSIFRALRGLYEKPEERRVLDRVSLEVRHGERLGIVGPNGAGKSTLLKVMASILRPTSGSVFVHGVVAPLIEIGAGFDPDLSVVDNVILYGVLLGFNREAMAARMEAILEFAELEPYRYALVKTLSSGMLARLGFGVASDIQPDVLLIDEVLSVGDEHFRKKSRERIMGFWEQGIASVIVSHDLSLIAEACDRVVCMDAGRIGFIGSPRTAVRFYLDAVAEREGQSR